MRCLRHWLTILLVLISATTVIAAEPRERLSWESLPDLPEALGLGGPIVGVHNDALIVGGGANFAEPVWENDKAWHDAAWVLTRDGNGGYTWHDGFKLDRPIAYAACASTEHGVVCIGGNDGNTTFAECFLLQWDDTAQQLKQVPLPSLSPALCLWRGSQHRRNRVSHGRAKRVRIVDGNR